MVIDAARSGEARRVSADRRRLSDRRAASKDVPPELLEEVFELNMMLEELKGGDESARPQLETAKQNFLKMRAEIDRELGDAVRQVRCRGIAKRNSEAGAARDSRRAEPAALHRKPDPRCGEGVESGIGQPLEDSRRSPLTQTHGNFSNRFWRKRKSKIVGIDLGHDQQPGRLYGPDRSAHHRGCGRPQDCPERRFADEQRQVDGRRSRRANCC